MAAFLAPLTPVALFLVAVSIGLASTSTLSGAFSGAKKQLPLAQYVYKSLVQTISLVRRKLMRPARGVDPPLKKCPTIFWSYRMPLFKRCFILGAASGLNVSQTEPSVSQRKPTWIQREPSGSQKEPKMSQREANLSPQSSNVEPNSGQGEPPLSPT